ncbi:hypothetical protein CDAR_436431 [Caerostris darwini]|uniref:Uncharacterized protein n=1 Tax=Caerostris darwini TaxID=1538125 RepID=A0AAV4VBX7_9ARAC|nr:hypothetical protein CDAR_436431 [Caerostris darwini]
MASGVLGKKRRRMKSASFHSPWDVPKDGQGRAKQEKERALPADCLLPVLVYDAHGRRKRYCTEHLEARGWKWMRNKTKIYALRSPNGLRSTNSEISTKYRDHQIACRNDPASRLEKSAEILALGRTKGEKKYISPGKNGKEMSSGGSEKRRRKMKSVSFHSTWDVPKDGRDVPIRKKEEHYPLIVCFQFWFTTPMGDKSVIA